MKNSSTPNCFSLNSLIKRLLLCALLLSPATIAFAQTNSESPSQSTTTNAPAPPPDAENIRKAEAILRRAVEAMGGAAYTNVRTIIGRGLFTPYQGGVSGIPFAFRDFVVYPGKNRTEFRGSGNLIVQTNAGDAGWTFDGAQRKITEAKPDQLQDFDYAVRASIDTLLRGDWRKKDAVLSYVGRREAGLAQRNETVRLTYPDGFTVEHEFNERTGLPAKTIYKRANKAGEMIAEEDRYAQFISTNGVQLPFIIDHYRAGTQTSRVNYESVELNKQILEGIFARPADYKALRETLK